MAQVETGEVTADLARNAVLGALEDAGQQVLAHNLEEGEWSVRGIEVSVKVAMSQVMIDVALGAGAEADDSDRSEQDGGQGR